MQRLSPTLAFDKGAEDAVKFYVSIFKDSKILKVNHFGENEPGTAGTVSSPSIMQQCLQAGLLDELHIDLVPILLGAGVRLFDNLEANPIELESMGVIEGTGVTHLQNGVVVLYYERAK
jgi:dihydrofolate reductase